MCGRFTLVSTEEQIAAVLPGLVFDVPIEPRYNVAPTQTVAAVLNENPQHVQGVRWGLIPHWAKDAAIGSRMINARGETVHEKPSFKRPFARQRCLVLADGYYEWTEAPGQKRRQPIYIRRRDRAPFAFAGLWDRWSSPEGERITTATIVTTAPNAQLSTVHDRMPVILPAERIPTWLAPGEQSADVSLACIAAFPGELLEFFAVSTHVNTPRNDDAKCIVPVAVD